MSDIDQLLQQLPLDEIADELGVDQSQAEASSRTALEALLGGLHANSQDPAGAASLAQALGQHDNDLLGSGLGGVDTSDGQQIVENIFGGNTDNVIAQLGGVRGSGGSSLIAKLLPILAPFVLSYLAKQLAGRGGLGSILGQVLGGVTGAGGAGGAGAGSGGGLGGGGLGDILGQVLGGVTGAGSGASGGSTGTAAPEQPTGPLIPTDGSAPADTTAADQGGRDQSSGGLGGGLGDILGQILGGAAGGASAGSGGSASSDQPSITDILGGLLGGGKR